MTHADYKEMLELEALGLLDGAERRVLSEHLSACAECRAVLGELRDTAAELVYLTAPVTAPAALRARILEAVRARPALPTSRQTTADERGVSGDGRTTTSSNVVPSALPPRRGWDKAAPYVRTAAVVVIIALVVALVALWNRNRALRAEVARLSLRNDETQANLARLAQSNDELQAELARTSKHNDELQAELNHPTNRNTRQTGTANPPEPGAPAPTSVPSPNIAENDSRVVELTATGVAARARARLSYNRRTGVIDLVVSDMPSAPAGKTYQLWLLIGGSPVSAGTFNTGPGGRAMLHGQLAADALEASAFAVTLEPAGGSNKPTGPKYLLGSAL